MDNVSMANPQDFIAMGATAEQATDLARQADALAGRRGFAAQAEVAHGMDNYVPPSPAAPEAKPTAQQMTDAANDHDAAQVGDLAQVLGRPPSPSDYRLSSYNTEATPSDEGLAADSQMETAFHSIGVYKGYSDAIMSNLREVGAAIEAGTQTLPTAAQLNSDKAWLTEKTFGGDYASGMALVDGFLDELRQQPDYIGAIQGYAQDYRRLAGVDIDLKTYEDLLLSQLAANRSNIDMIYQMAKLRAGNRTAAAGSSSGASFEGVSPVSLSQAKAEYEQLMADRGSGKISNYQWRLTGIKREQELANIIAGAGR